DITERKRKENALKKLNRTLKALSDSNQALIRSTNEQEYLDKICEIIVEDCGYSMVWIGFAEDDADKSIRPVAEAGFNDDYLKTINVTWADTNFGQGPTGRSVRERVPCICGNMFIDPNFAPWREEALRRGYASSLALPMMDGSKVLGALTMYAREPNSFSDEEIRLLSELADDVAHGITLFRLRAARDEAELKLRKQADILQEQAEMLEQGYIFVRDQNDVIIFWNQGAEKLYGYTKEEAVGRVSHDLLKTEFYEPREDIEAELIETGKWEGELTHTTRYGMEIDVASHWTAHFDQYANLVGIIEFNNDITQLKMTEKMLSETSDYLDKLFNFANAPIVCWDTESKITKFNHAFERLTGYWAEEIIGQNINLLFPEENRELPIKDAVYTMEIPILNKNGEQRVVLWNSADIYGEDGKTLLATIAQAQDITEKAKELADARVKLEKSKRLSDIGVLAATVAHELRNPLATINIISAVIRRKTNDDNVKHYLNNIEKSVRESDQIINNLLYYSRIKPPHFENVRLGCIIEECLDTVKKQSQKKVCLNKSLDKLNNIVLKVDPLQMKEVFNNILNNAFDATSDGNGLIKVLASDLAETIEISIEDNGVGIKKEDIEKAFDPFFTTKAKGTGLGLSVCQQIVSLHGGKIGIESELNEGTKVRVILPKKVETVQ
ncbi:MAG: PAS domain S-box protein, partial [bacterium]